MGKRSSVHSLPPAVRAEVERRLALNGFRGYEELAEELRGQGFIVSKSALHRFGKKLEPNVAAALAARLALERDGPSMRGVPEAPAAPQPEPRASRGPRSTASIGARLRHERERIGVTQEAMCERAGLPLMTYKKYEENHVIPGGAALARMSLAGVDIVWVLTGVKR